MSYAALNHRALDAFGNLITGVDVRIKRETAGQPLATIRGDREGTFNLSNPTTSGYFSDGKILCYLTGGAYQVEVLKDAVVLDTFRHVAVGTAQEQDSDAVKQGVLMWWDTGTSDADPGTGNVRANNASLASATTLYVSELNRAGSSIENFLASLDDASNTTKGYLTLTDPATEAQAIFRVTAITDATNYHKITVTGHSGATSFTDGDPITLQFARSGDAVTDSASVTHNGTTVDATLDALPGRNHIINGCFRVAQRGTSFTDAGGANNNDTYNLDRWYLLSDGNDIVDVSQDTADVPAGGLYAAKMLVATVNKKFGLAQIVEQKNAIGLIGQQVTLSFYAKVNNTTRLDKIKAAIIAHDGTADTISSSIVGVWGADGTTPSFNANNTLENTPADLGVTTSWARYSVTATIDTASTKNIIVFIWSDNVTDTDAGDTLSVADVQLELGPAPTVFERRPYGFELSLCQRYFQRIAAGNLDYICGGFCKNTTDWAALLRFVQPFRVAPAMSISAASHVQLLHVGGALTAATAFTLTAGDLDYARIDGSVASGLTTGAGMILTGSSASMVLDFSAEL